MEKTERQGGKREEGKALKKARERETSPDFPETQESGAIPAGDPGWQTGSKRSG